MTARQLKDADEFPLHLLPEFASLPLEPEWVWVAEDGGVIVGVIACLRGHGMVLPLRIMVADDAPQSTALLLLRAARRGSQRGGCVGFAAFLNLERDEEARLARIGERMGATVRRVTHVLMGGPFHA